MRIVSALGSQRERANSSMIVNRFCATAQKPGNGETRHSESHSPLLFGDKATVERVEGFVLTVSKVPIVSNPKQEGVLE